MPRITDLWAAVTKADDGDEALLVLPMPKTAPGDCPLITGNPERIAWIREKADLVSRQESRPYRLLRYTVTTDEAPEKKEEDGPRRIKELWAYLAIEGPGPDDEGIMASNMGGGSMIVPLIGADRARAVSFSSEAETITKATGKPHRLARFKLVGEATRRF
jgi:hypothetical protein